MDNYVEKSNLIYAIAVGLNSGIISFDDEMTEACIGDLDVLQIRDTGIPAYSILSAVTKTKNSKHKETLEAAAYQEIMDRAKAYCNEAVRTRAGSIELYASPKVKTVLPARNLSELYGTLQEDAVRLEAADYTDPKIRTIMQNTIKFTKELEGLFALPKREFRGFTEYYDDSINMDLKFWSNEFGDLCIPGRRGKTVTEDDLPSALSEAFYELYDEEEVCYEYLVEHESRYYLALGIGIGTTQLYIDDPVRYARACCEALVQDERIGRYKVFSLLNMEPIARSYITGTIFILIPADAYLDEVKSAAHEANDIVNGITDQFSKNRLRLMHAWGMVEKTDGQIENPLKNLNTSGILTALIQEAGKCKSYASDLFLSWAGLQEDLQGWNRPGKTSYLFGFRDDGVDMIGTWTCRTREMYNSVYRLDVELTEEYIRMDLYKI